MTIIEMMVVVSLTFMDGSFTQYKLDNDAFPTVQAANGDEAVALCKKKGDEIVSEMKIDFKDNDPKPSTFLLVCTEKEK